MRKLVSALLAAAALAAPAAAPAQPRQLPPAFDASRPRPVAEQLVLCDMTRFLLSRPDLTANQIYVRRQLDNRFDVLLPPYYVSGGEFYDEDLELAYRRLRREGRISFDQVLAAQTGARGFIESYRLQPRGGLSYRRAELEPQRQWCRATFGRDRT